MKKKMEKNGKRFGRTKIKDYLCTRKTRNALATLYVENKITLEQAKGQLEEKNIETLNRTIMQMKVKM